MSADLINSYLINVKALLAQNPKYALMVERQIQLQLVPKITGYYQELATPLLHLLFFCWQGKVDHDLKLSKQAVLELEQALAQPGMLKFAQAASTLWQVYQKLQQFGLYPVPLQPGHCVPSAKTA